MTLMFVTRIWGLTWSLQRRIESNESVHQPNLSATVSTSACETNPESESSSSSGSQSEDEMPVPDARLFSFNRLMVQYSQTLLDPFFSFYLINRMENMDPVWLCCTISLSKDITLSFLTANVSIKDAIVLS